MDNSHPVGGSEDVVISLVLPNNFSPKTFFFKMSTKPSYKKLYFSDRSYYRVYIYPDRESLQKHITEIGLTKTEAYCFSRNYPKKDLGNICLSKESHMGTVVHETFHACRHFMRINTIYVMRKDRPVKSESREEVTAVLLGNACECMFRIFKSA